MHGNSNIKLTSLYLQPILQLIFLTPSFFSNKLSLMTHLLLEENKVIKSHYYAIILSGQDHSLWITSSKPSYLSDLQTLQILPQKWFSLLYQSLPSFFSLVDGLYHADMSLDHSYGCHCASPNHSWTLHPSS